VYESTEAAKILELIDKHNGNQGKVAEELEHTTSFSFVSYSKYSGKIIMICMLPIYAFM
jgi:hypothetical protein